MYKDKTKLNEFIEIMDKVYGYCQVWSY